MSKFRRHIISFIFGSILVFPILAIGILQIGQAYIRSTREERLQKEKLVQVVIPAKDLMWEEEGKELKVGHRLFDVASLTLVDGHYLASGVFDEQETKMAGSLWQILLSKKGSNLLHLLLLLQCFTLCFCFIDLALKLQKQRNRYSEYPFFLPSPLHLVKGPPPRH